ncbi:MAG: RNA pyrophosphohydrolase [Rhodospirillaceae bacterium]|jgi:putative (di)nucleoside polyphosphate hydrolase|nr:RNA pyrophosphohydrolase [Rhodospirillaceae bacterium]MBT4939844.1 RNA pyrophosphohydrolase [Rhodospirillaceae bacterium]MBT5938794.1 RNA pyrophosphohydrolase [Rhodospirillaceae bacterium]MBT7266470.1 RNA pyrophosphohydrolase [Rhodospirillaceae bacterium]
MPNDKPLSELPYRPCAGIVLFNDLGQVFVGRRLDTYQDAWQLPQGGIDEGEEPQDAAVRELEEEIGTAKAEIIGEAEDWLSYDLPPDLLGKVWNGRYRGQTQKWFAMRFLGDDSEINPSAVKTPEFGSWKWAELTELPEMAVTFKKSIYQTLVSEFSRFAKATR